MWQNSHIKIFQYICNARSTIHNVFHSLHILSLLRSVLFLQTKKHGQIKRGDVTSLFLGTIYMVKK